MAPLGKDLKILFQRSGNRCAFPKCYKSLTYFEDSSNGHINLSEVAHIVARSGDGPRGDYPLPMDQRDTYENLILLCEEHHHVIDEKKYTYTVERLRQMKADHEALMGEVTSQAAEIRTGSDNNQLFVQETLYSTLLPVLMMPRYIYGISCNYNDSQEREASKEIDFPHGEEMCPFIIRGGMLFCFQNLRYKGSPFRRLVGNRKVERFSTRDWCDDPDRMAWFVSLLNRSLNKLTGRKGLHLDKRHRRYYFVPKESGRSLEISYRPINKSSADRQVVWQPVVKKTGTPRSYWYHRAVALRFHMVGEEQWCLSIRPEMHVTKDGQNPLDSEKIGSRVTHKKARMFNYDLLREVHFWRDFLSDSQPRIVFPFGEKQSIVVSTKMMQSEINWPGVPEEHARPFKNVEYEEDLFTSEALSRLEISETEDEEGWEEFTDNEP